MSDNQPPASPPPAQGVRLDWAAVPAPVRAEVERRLGSPVAEAISQPMGFSPGVAARLRLADSRRVFVKAAGPKPNPGLPAIHRQEARVVSALPVSTPSPRLLAVYDEGEDSSGAAAGWIVLVFEEVEGHHPAQPWEPGELKRVLEALAGLGDLLTPSPLAEPVVQSASAAFASAPGIYGRLTGWRQLFDAKRLDEDASAKTDRLDAWSARNLDALVALEAQAAQAAAGSTLLHFDVRADNLLLSPGRVWFVDWPLACVGAAWVDAVFFAPSIAMQGGPAPEEVIAQIPACRAADPQAVTAVIAAVAGFFTHRALQPPPPGLPTVRAFQAAQGAVARRWLEERI